MPLPPDIDRRIRTRFNDLLTESELLVKDMEAAERQSRERARHNGAIIFGEIEVLSEQFYSFRTRFLSLVQLLSTRNLSINSMVSEVQNLDNMVSNAMKLRGYLSGLKDDYEAGMLEDLTELIEANIAADYLGQAEQLLVEGQPGKNDHVPAAVLSGSILEKNLRVLCGRAIPEISTLKANGEPKTMNILIDDLRKANVFNELKAKQLRSWADIRNAAAHGEFEKFGRQDVEQMLVGVRNFLADYL